MWIAGFNRGGVPLPAGGPMAKTQRAYWQRTRRLAIWLLVFWCLLVLLVPLAAPQLEVVAVLGLPLSYYAGAQGLLVALVIASFLFAHGQRRIDRSLPGQVQGEPAGGVAQLTDLPVLLPDEGGVAAGSGALAMAADWLSGAMMIAIAGALYSLGHDGLAWLLGLFGGAVLAHVLVGPHLKRAGGFGVVEFVTARFGGVAGAIALCIAIVTTALLIAANIKAVVAALGVLVPGFPIRTEAGILMAAMVFAIAALGRIRAGLTRLQAIAFPLLLAALVMPLAFIALEGNGAMSNPVSYGGVLQAISTMELDLLEKELADPVTLKTYVRPLTSETATSSLLLVLSLALGVMALPHVSRRPALALSQEGARFMPAVALLLVLLAVLFLPPMSALGRHFVLAELVGKETAALTPAVFEMGGRGLVKICGTEALSSDAVSAACAALADWPGHLRLDDIAIERDRVLFVLPLLMGLPVLTADVLAATVIVSSLLAVAWLGATLAGLAYPGYVQTSARRATVLRVAGVLAVIIAAVLAATIAMVFRDVEILMLIGWALAVAGAGLAPALVGGVWSQRATASSAVVAMLAGAGVTLYYIVGTRYFAASFHEMWGSFSGAGYGAIAEYEAAKEALVEAIAAATADPGSMQAQETLSAARTEVATAARGVADWWGIKSVASGVLGVGLGAVLMVSVSLISPRPGALAVSVISRMRGFTSRV